MPNLTEASLCELVAATMRDLHPDELGLPEVTTASTLDRDLGFDSLGRMELLTRVEHTAGIALPEETLQAAESVADLWRAVEQGRPFTTPVPRAAVPLPTTGTSAVPGETLAATDEAETLLDVLDARVRTEPDGTQLICLADEVETRISHRQLAQAAAAVAAGLQRAGLRPRQTVAIMLPTSPEYFFTYFGILRAGGIPVPIYPPARASQLEDHVRRHTGILANAQARLMVSVPQAMTVARLQQPRDRDCARCSPPSSWPQAAACPSRCRCAATTSPSSSTRRAAPVRPRAWRSRTPTSLPTSARWLKPSTPRGTTSSSAGCRCTTTWD